MSGMGKFLSDMGPLAVFFLVYKWYGLIEATAALIAATFVSVLYVYWSEKKIPTMPLASAVLVGIFGGLTIISEDEVFIKMKPTILNTLFGLILLIGVCFRKGLLQYLLDDAFKMKAKAWRIFSFRWALFFFFLAIVNEIVWRNFGTDFWVKFKVFGMLPLTMAFTLTQVPFIQKHHIVEDKQ